MVTNSKLFDPSVLGKIYEPDLKGFAAAGKKAGLKPASEDRFRRALVLIDEQNDFMDQPGAALPVPGALGDVQRVIEYIIRNAEKISKIFLSLDTHTPRMIFHPEWWINMETRKHPDPLTMITFKDIVSGKWQALVDPKWSIEYVDFLEKQAKKNLMIWPYHCLVGTDGQKIVPALAEIVAWHSAARGVDPEFITKGTDPRTEHYGIFRAERPDPRDVSTLMNTKILDPIASFDAIDQAGEAETHCFDESAKQEVEYFGNQPDVLKKIRFLTDCMSPVKHPTIDFHTLAMADFKEMQKKGVILAKSTDPI